MKKANNQQTEEEKIEICRKSFFNQLHRGKRNIIIGIVLILFYFILSVLNSSKENKAVWPLSLFLPVLWGFQSLILKELRKDKNHIKRLFHILVCYFIFLICCVGFLSYKAASGSYLVEKIILIALIVQIVLHTIILLTTIYSLKFKFKKITYLLFAPFAGMALAIVPFVQLILFGFGIYNFCVMILLIFNPFNYFYGVTAFLWSSIGSFTFMFINISQIRDRSNQSSLWRDSFPNLSDTVEQKNELGK